MRPLLLLLLSAIAVAVEFIPFEVQEDKQKAWETDFPGVPYFPALKLESRAAEAVPAALQGTWFRVGRLVAGKPELGDAAWRVGKMNRAPLPEGAAQVFERVGVLPGGLVVVNQFHEKTGKLTGRPNVYAVK